jgi:homocysteine S-methyltransferase
MTRSITDAIAEGPIVLDGGLGTLLAAHGHDLSSSLWSAQLLLDDPAAIRRAHVEYFEAGARVAITSSYQVSYEGLDAAGHDRAQADTLLARSVHLGRAARDEAGLGAGDAWVAASVGPYGATLADGSEYTGRYGLSVAALREWHRPRLEVLAAASPDLIAVETIPSLAELEAICGLLGGLGVPAWVSVTVADGALRTGESLEEALAMAASVDDVIAVGVNCCDDAQIPGALAVARAAGKPGVAYPNSGELWHADTRTWSGLGSEVHCLAASWIDAGAGFVGGCCRVGPAQIAQIAQVVNDRREG